MTIETTATMGRTTIQVSDELADELHDRKGRGESYEDVIWRLIDHADTGQTTTPDPGTEQTAATDEPEPAHHQTPAEILKEWRPGHAGKDRERRREIGTTALNWLRERDAPASAEEFKRALYEDHHMEGQGEDAWWRRTARPAIQLAEDAGHVEYSHGNHEYRWIDEGAD